MRVSLGAVSKPYSALKMKTGDWGTHWPKIDEELCNGCGICEMYCPDLCIELVKVGEEKVNDKIKEIKKARVNYDYCKGCGICAEVCPTKAITMELKEIYKVV